MQNVKVCDSGVYSVCINNLTRSIKVIVRAYFSKEVSIHRKNDKVEMKEGDSVVFEVKNIVATTDVIWMKDDQPIIRTKMKAERRGSNHILKVPDIDVDDNGKYSVCFNNESTTVLLKVTGTFAIPVAIEHMSKQQKEQYLRILNEGSEKRHFVKICFLGKKEAGKTTLMKRLLKQDIDINTRSPTDGIDIVKQCKILLDTGEWINCTEEYILQQRIGHAMFATEAEQRQEAKDIKDTTLTSDSGERENLKTDQEKGPSGESILYKRIGQAMFPRELEQRQETKEDIKDTTLTSDSVKRENNLKTEEGKGPGDDSTFEQRKGQTMHAVESKEKLPNTNDTNDTERISESVNKETNSKTEKEKYKDFELNHESLEPTAKLPQKTDHSAESSFSTTKKETSLYPDESNCQDFEQKEEQDIVSDEPTNETTVAISSSRYAECIMLDFAGHKEYYTTHQTFLTPSAINIVTVSLNDKTAFCNDVEDEEKIHFWFDSVHCYCNSVERKDGKLDPPIIVVCTHCDGENHEKIQKEFDGKLNDVLIENQRRSHVHGKIFFLSNAEDEDLVYGQLRNLIYSIATTLPNWGECLPTRWIQLEKKLNDIRKDTPMFELEQIVKLAKSLDIPITNASEVEFFLQYQHMIGNVIFFQDLKEYVIIAPQWLANVFKRVVFAEQVRSEYIEHPEWGDLKQNGRVTLSFLKKPLLEHIRPDKKIEHIIQLMEKFDIIVPGERGEFIIPSMISRETTSAEFLKSIHERYGVNETNRTSWLCLEFDFLPPSLFNHIIVNMMKDEAWEKKELAHGISIFQQKEYRGFRQLFVGKSHNNLYLQFWLKDETKANQGKIAYDKIRSVIYAINERYGMSVHYYKKFLCGAAEFSQNNIIENPFSIPYLQKGDFHCRYHTKRHTEKDALDMFTFWIGNDCLIGELTLDNDDVMEGTNVTFFCELIDNKVDVTWFKNDKLVPLGEKVKVQTGGDQCSLKLYDITTNDSGKYHAVLNKRDKTKIKQLKVKGYFSKPLTCNEEIITEGETIELSCEVVDSSMEAEWKKEGHVLQNSDSLKIEVYKMKHTLQISNAKPTDSGEYSICFNNISRKTSVIVIDFFITPLKESICTEFENVIFTCEVSRENLTAKWFKDDAQIPESDSMFAMKSEIKLHSLHMERVKQSDSGTYKVEFENGMSSTADLVVLENISDDEMNYFKIMLLLKKIAEPVVRMTFDANIHPDILSRILEQHMYTVMNLKKRKQISLNEYNLLLPRRKGVSLKPSSSDFDIRLMILLLRNLLGGDITDHLPPDYNHTVDADLSRIKFYRNEIYQQCVKGSMKLEDFDEIWNNLYNPLLRLGGEKYKQKLSNLKNMKASSQVPLTNLNRKFTTDLSDHPEIEEDQTDNDEQLCSLPDGDWVQLHNEKRAFMINRLVDRASRAKFDSEFQPASLKQIIWKNINFFEQMRDNKELTETQWNCLFPQNGEPSSGNFDFSLRLKLISSSDAKIITRQDYDDLSKLKKVTDNLRKLCYEKHELEGIIQILKRLGGI